MILKRFSIFAAVAFVTVSCLQETATLPFGVVKDDSGETEEDTRLHIFSSVSGLDWTKENKILVFSSDNGKYEFSVPGDEMIEGNQFDYTYEEWPEGKEPKYAVFNSQKDNPGTPSENISIGEGKISVEVYPEQRPSAMSALPRFAPVLLAEVMNGGDIEDPSYTAVFHQLTGYIRFRIGFNDVKSIALSSVEGVNLAGKVNVNVSSIEEGDFEYTVTEGSSSIVVEPQTGGEEAVADKIDEVWCLKGSKTGYFTVAVLPGVFTPVFTLTDKEGNTVTYTAPKQITVPVSGCVDLKIIDAPGDYTLYVINNKTLASTTPTIGSASNRLQGSFSVTQDGISYPFIIENEISGSSSSNGLFKNNNGLYFVKGLQMKLPRKEGYSLSSLYLAAGVTLAGIYSVSSFLDDTFTDIDKFTLQTTGDGISTYPDKKVDITCEYDAEREFYLRTNSSSGTFCVSTFSLTYSPIPLK